MYDAHHQPHALYECMHKTFLFFYLFLYNLVTHKRACKE